MHFKNSQFINDDKYNWNVELADSMYIAYIGRGHSVKNLTKHLKFDDELNIPVIKKTLNTMVGNFSVVIETDRWIFGVVDRICGYKLFYRRDKIYGCILSNSPRKLLSENAIKFDPDISSILEMKMAGYVTGNRTIDKKICQLSAGEMLLYDKSNNKLSTDNYFEFYSPNVRDESNDVLIDELDDITNTIIGRNISDANGNTIWVPLSGGLDSRLIVCKLKQLGYDNIRTYSYGMNGNFDALRAKKIAETLGISWEFIPTLPEESREFFLSKERVRYWEFADGLSAVPNLHGMFALKCLLRSKKMKKGDVIINGQSGDFISGQHIPKIGNLKVNNSLLLDKIIQKHYPLRKDMLSDSENLDLIKTLIRQSLGKYEEVESYQSLAKSYEYWEWKERQAKRVINGQCNYDYLGLNWVLPLWDLEYLRFWRDLPLNQKNDRNLFVEYLDKKNFYGLFDGYQPFMSRWPKNRIYIQFFGNILSKTLGKKISNRYYERLDWFSQYQYIYALTEYSEYKLQWDNYKGPYPYMTDVWLHENINT